MTVYTTTPLTESQENLKAQLLAYGLDDLRSNLERLNQLRHLTVQAAVDVDAVRGWVFETYR